MASFLFQPKIKLSKAFWANHRERIQGQRVIRINLSILVQDRASSNTNLARRGWGFARSDPERVWLHHAFAPASSSTERSRSRTRTFAAMSLVKERARRPA